MKLTLGSCLFHWKPAYWRDFYFKMADESPIDVIYLGEVVCGKRAPFYEKYIDEIISRLQNSGKEVVRSTPSMVLGKLENDAIENALLYSGMLEINELTPLTHLKNRNFVVGQFVNVYNEATAKYLASQGAKRIALNAELDYKSIAVISKALAEIGVETEVQIFGRVSLANSARCYHARAHMRSKNNCAYVCNLDYNGMELDSMAGERFLAVNGTQTLSAGYYNLLGELSQLKDMGISHFRISPHDIDMVLVTKLIKDVIDNKIEVIEAENKIAELIGDADFSNGFFYGIAGADFVALKEIVE